MAKNIQEAFTRNLQSQRSADDDSFRLSVLFGTLGKLHKYVLSLPPSGNDFSISVQFEVPMQHQIDRSRPCFDCNDDTGRALFFPNCVEKATVNRFHLPDKPTP
jgi:hypothetical protein